MATGGLSRTDTGTREVIGGLALEFYYRVGNEYDIRRFKNPVAWFYEPKVGERVMRKMLSNIALAEKLLDNVHENDNYKECKRNIGADVRQRNSEE